MSYLLIILFPLAMAAGCFVLRKQQGVAVAMAVATAITEALLVNGLPADQPARLLGLIVVLDPLTKLFLLAYVAMIAVAAVATLRIPHGENFLPVALITLGLVGAIMLLLQEPFTVALLLVSSSVLAVLAIVDLPSGSAVLVGRVVIATALKYLVLLLVAGVAMYMAFVLMTIYEPGEAAGRVSPARLTLALMAIGFGIRLALVPFHSWLPDLVEHAAPMVTVLVVALLNSVALLFWVQSLQFFPLVVFENERGMALLMAGGVLTTLLGGGLALAQANMRRMIGYLLIYNAGMILFGLATTTPDGLAGALYEAFNQTIAVTLLLVSVGLLERPDGRPATQMRQDLLWRWPIASTGLLVGGMALLGLPPLSGFAGKLLLYEAAAKIGGPYLALLLISTGLAALAFTKLARERLFGAPEDLPQEERVELLGQTELDRPAERRLEAEPRELAFLTVALLAICLGLGLYPQPLLATIHEVVRGLPFVRI
ncbi:MAG: proton-conducting transporter membrane subunit [Roseiflexaceae bacterium]